MCQCPERGDLHFYSIIIGSVKLLERCVNALKGATSISTTDTRMLDAEEVTCQCPERGDLHFYVTVQEEAPSESVTVSMP